jgi:hypothetical protein
MTSVPLPHAPSLAPVQLCDALLPCRHLQVIRGSHVGAKVVVVVQLGALRRHANNAMTVAQRANGAASVGAVPAWPAACTHTVTEGVLSAAGSTSCKSQCLQHTGSNRLHCPTITLCCWYASWACCRSPVSIFIPGVAVAEGLAGVTIGKARLTARRSCTGTAGSRTATTNTAWKNAQQNRVQHCCHNTCILYILTHIISRSMLQLLEKGDARMRLHCTYSSSCISTFAYVQLMPASPAATYWHC